MRAMVLAVAVVPGVIAIPASDGAAIPASGELAATQVEFYQEGNRLYQEGDFEGALTSYLRLVEAGF